MSIIHAVLLGILGGIGIWDSRVFGMCMLDRPLVLGPLVGLILGDLQTGIIIGASLELVMMGVVGIGSATPPDTVSGSILATVFAISAKLDVSAACSAGTSHRDTGSADRYSLQNSKWLLCTSGRQGGRKWRLQGN